MAAAIEAKAPSEQVESLTLAQALEMAESLQPQRAEAKAMVEAAEGWARQAGTFPIAEAIVGAQQIPCRSNAANLSAQPESALADADLRARTARVDLAKSERIPEVKVELPYHWLQGIQANTFDLGLSIPLPLFNRNQGKLREARAEVATAEARSRMTQNELTTRLRESYLQLTAALASSRTLKSEILSRAETVVKGAEARYAAGDIGLAELLPVRRDWAAVQPSYLESLRDVMQARATLSPYAGRQ